MRRCLQRSLWHRTDRYSKQCPHFCHCWLSDFDDPTHGLRLRTRDRPYKCDARSRTRTRKVLLSYGPTGPEASDPVVPETLVVRTSPLSVVLPLPVHDLPVKSFRRRTGRHCSSHLAGGRVGTTVIEQRWRELSWHSRRSPRWKVEGKWGKSDPPPPSERPERSLTHVPPRRFPHSVHPSDTSTENGKGGSVL